MKKIFLLTVLLLILNVGWAQISKNMKTTNGNNNNNNNHPPTQTQNVQNNATNHVVQQGAIIPVPKKIASFQSKRSLNLVSSSFTSGSMMVPVSNSSTATSRPADQKQKMIQAGILGMVSKNINGVKTGYVLTNKTSSWGATTNFSKSSKVKGQDNSNPGMNCVVTDETLTAQSTSFLNANKNEQGQHLYPGAIYTFDDYANGNFKPFENGRNPIEVMTNATGVSGNGGSISQTVQNPIQSAIRQAVSNLVSRFSPSMGGGTVIQQTLYTNNLSEFSITVAGGGAYDGYSGSDFYSHNQSENHIYISIDATKILYTMSVPRPANGFFTNGQIPQANSPLVMVQDVTYGGRVLANMDFTISSNTDLNKFKFNYDAPTANAFFDLNAMTHDSTVSYTINSYLVGVPSSTGIIVKGQDFEQQINNILSQCNYRNAQPIAYTLMDMDGNTLGVESMTDHFPIRECTPAAEVWTLDKAWAIIKTGQDGKNDDSNFLMYLISKDDNKAAAFCNIVKDQSIEVKGNTTTTFPMGGTASSGLNATPFNGVMKSSFNGGGSINLQLDASVMKNDDWDMTSLTIKLDFISQKGNHWQPTPMVMNNIRLSSGHYQTFFFDGNFNIIQ